jgi:hypothetical protein
MEPTIYYYVHKTVSWAGRIQYTSWHHISLTCIIILHFHQDLILTNCILSSGFRTKILGVFIISPIRATRSVHIILFKFIMYAEAEVAQLA